MQVARYWRTKKLRYRLIAMTEPKGRGRKTSAATPPNLSARDRLPAVTRVTVPS